jgi:hypothetical protein
MMSGARGASCSNGLSTSGNGYGASTVRIEKRPSMMLPDLGDLPR